MGAPSTPGVTYRTETPGSVHMHPVVPLTPLRQRAHCRTSTAGRTADLYELIKAEVQRDTSAIRGPRGLGALFSDVAASAAAERAAKRPRLEAAAVPVDGEAVTGDGGEGDDVMADGDGEAGAGTAGARSAAAGTSASPVPGGPGPRVKGKGEAVRR
jgi:hypothetical protein